MTNEKPGFAATIFLTTFTVQVNVKLFSLYFILYVFLVYCYIRSACQHTIVSFNSENFFQIKVLKHSDIAHVSMYLSVCVLVQLSIGRGPLRYNVFFQRVL